MAAEIGRRRPDAPQQDDAVGILNIDEEQGLPGRGQNVLLLVGESDHRRAGVTRLPSHSDLLLFEIAPLKKGPLRHVVRLKRAKRARSGRSALGRFGWFPTAKPERPLTDRSTDLR